MKKLTGILILLTWVCMTYGQTNTRVLDAFAYYEKEEYGMAAGLFEDLADEQDIREGKFQYYAGLSNYQLGNFGQAEHNFEQAMKGGYHEALLWLAKINVVSGSQEASISYLKQYLHQAGIIDINRIKKDPVFRELHNTESWFALWQEENLNPGVIAFTDAKSLISRKQFSEAQNLLDDQPITDNDQAEFHALKSELFLEEGNPQLSVDEINQALKTDPDNTLYLRMRADYLEKSGRIKEATDAYSAILEITPEDFSVRFSRAKLYFDQGLFDAAERDLQILNHYFDRTEYKFLLGETHYETSNYVFALKIFNRIIESETPRAEYYKARGMTYYKTRIFDQAAYDLSMSLDLSPDNAETNLYMGLAEKSLGNTKMACYYLLRARRFGSTEADNYLSSYCK
jgi:tetratricopeptide (TPR) repeat protein